MKKTVLPLILIIALLVILVYMFRFEFFRIFPKPDLIFLSKRELKNSGIQAIQNGDEPISAIVLYNYVVVGKGYNTILSDTNVAGHAIINAINDAVKSMGWEQFNSSDKSSYIIMTTTEPCELCKSVIKEYGFLKVEFMKKRPLNYWLNSYWQDIAYEFRKRQLDPSDLQDSLYLMKSDHQQNSPNKY